MGKMDSSTGLAERVAIVTGASRGLGSDIARRLDEQGFSVLISYRSRVEAAESVASSLRNAIAVKADLSDSKDISRLFDTAEERFGGVDVLVNNAGVIDSKRSLIADISEETWDEIFSTNCRGTFLACREACRRLRRNAGRIINVSGTLVATPKPGFGAYSASKAAVETLTRVLAAELLGSGITVNCVAPGPMATEMLFSVRDSEGIKQVALASPLERLGECRDVANVVCFLAAVESSAISGQILRVNGGIA